MSAVSSMHLFVTSIHPYILVLEQYLVRLAIASCVCDIVSYVLKINSH